MGCRRLRHRTPQGLNADHASNVSRSQNLATHSRCSGVSGTCTRRAVEIASKAASGGNPTHTIADAAIDAERPISRATMDGNRFSFSHQIPHRAREACGRCNRVRYSSVGDREIDEVHATTPTEAGFRAQTELFNLRRLEQTDHSSDASGLPSGDLVFEPIAGARPRHDGQATRRGHLDPVEFANHALSTQLQRSHSIRVGSRSTASRILCFARRISRQLLPGQGIHIDAPFIQDANPCVPVHDGTVGLHHQ